MRLRRRIVKMPPDVEITFRINGQNVIGPITGENLAYIAKFGGYGDGENLLAPDVLQLGASPCLEFYIRYVPRP